MEDKEIITIRDINNNVIKLNGKVDELLVWKEVHNQKHISLDRDLTGVRDTLYGNPGGVLSKVERLWNCKVNISRWQTFWMQVLRGVLTASIFGVIVWALMMYKGA